METLSFIYLEQELYSPILHLIIINEQTYHSSEYWKCLLFLVLTKI